MEMGRGKIIKIQLEIIIKQLNTLLNWCQTKYDTSMDGELVFHL